MHLLHGFGKHLLVYCEDSFRVSYCLRGCFLLRLLGRLSYRFFCIFLALSHAEEVHLLVFGILFPHLREEVSDSGGLIAKSAGVRAGIHGLFDGLFWVERVDDDIQGNGAGVEPANFVEFRLHEHFLGSLHASTTRL